MDKGFRTEKDILAGVQAITAIPSADANSVGKAVKCGTPIADTRHHYVEYFIEDGVLSYHVFRGPDIPSSYWGTGEFGLAVLQACELAWRVDKHEVSYVHEALHPCAEVGTGENPADNPEHYFGSYYVRIPGYDKKPVSVDKSRIMRFSVFLEDILRSEVPSWSNGNGAHAD